jgi:uncharacterized membrane protein YjfL (UPF0719 family)
MPTPETSATEPLLGIAHTAIFAIGSWTIVLLGKLLRDRLAARHGHRIPLLITVQDNAATALEQAGFLLAAVLGLLGALRIQGELLEQVADLALTGALVVSSLLFNDWLMAKTVCRGIDCAREVNVQRNLAVAIPRAAGAIATGLVLRAALGHESPLWERLAWLGIGQAALVIISLIYQRWTPYDDLAELKRGNVAAGLTMAGVLLAVGIVVEAALAGEGAGWAADLRSVGIDLVLSVVLLQVMRWLADGILLPGTTLEHEIAKDQNVGAGLMEFTAMVSGAWVLAYYLN